MLAERIHGTGNDFIENMKMLRSKGIKTTNVYVLNPDYVKKTLTNNNAESLARGSVLYSFSYYSIFYANDGGVDYDDRRLRGVPSEARSADAPKIDQYDEALKLVTGNPSESLQRMQKNPNYATGLNALIGNYLKSKA